MGRWARSSFVSLGRSLSLCLLLASVACHARPTIQTVTAPEPTTAFNIRVNPPFVFAGQAVRVTCFVPWNDDNRVIRFGIEGISVQNTEIDRQGYSRVFERMECGTWQAVCAVADNLGRVKARSREIPVKGLCNDGGDVRN